MKKILLLGLLAFISTGIVAQSDDDIAPVEKLNALIFHIQRSYVEDVNTEEMVEEAIVAMLEELDPHSMYIPAEERKRMNEPLKGNFEGIGVQFNIIRDTILVVSPISGGPSEKLGILSGDRIVEIEGENVAGIGITNSDVMDKLKGPKDTKVNIAILRRGERNLIPYEITRDKIPIYSVDASYMATPEVGYIKINRFSATTLDEFQAALKSLKSEGMQDLILDLQGNGGGLLKAAVQLADEFLNEDKLIVYTEGRAYPRRETSARNGGGFEDGRLVILIDEGSASASEIVSGAVQDWDRGLIVGRRSFGKGLVQRPINLPDGSQVRLTVQKYYTPSGRSIQKPYTDGVEAYKKEKYDRFYNGELTSADSIDLPDSLKFYTHNERLVFGGGGIMPDIFVPLDTSAFSDLYSSLVRKGIFNRLSLDYVEQHRNELMKQYSDVEAYIADFELAADFETDIRDYAEKEDVDFDEAQYEKSRALILSRFKALIARNAFDTSAYYEVFNPFWPAYQKAIEVLEEDIYDAVDLANH